MKIFLNSFLQIFLQSFSKAFLKYLPHSFVFSFSFLLCFAHFQSAGTQSEEKVKEQTTEQTVEQATEQTVEQATEQADKSSDSEVINIYKYEREDCDKPVLEFWDTQKTLEDQGVKALYGSIGYDGLIYSIKEWGCKYPPRIHIFAIKKEYYETTKELGFKLCSALEDRGGKCHFTSYSELDPTKKGKVNVSVYKYSGEKNCNPDSGINVNDMEKELAEAKIVVYQKYTAVDGLHYLMACGSATGYINVYIIEKQGLARSKVMGFRECTWLSMQGGGCFSLR